MRFRNLLILQAAPLWRNHQPLCFKKEKRNKYEEPPFSRRAETLARLHPSPSALGSQGALAHSSAPTRPHRQRRPHREWQASSSAWAEPLSSKPQGQAWGHIAINSSLSFPGRATPFFSFSSSCRSTSLSTADAHLHMHATSSHTAPTLTHSPVTACTWPLLNASGCSSAAPANNLQGRPRLSATFRSLLSPSVWFLSCYSSFIQLSFFFFLSFFHVLFILFFPAICVKIV